ncbi:formate/nitrite transporter family protein [Natrialbaceae archaeon GCM10025810]|uniref:formate/nitrite transporter family protein n=1 Tax=Halovalidus salilacus TaxID=3075124 RepID=UPI0036178D1C
MSEPDRPHSTEPPETDSDDSSERTQPDTEAVRDAVERSKSGAPAVGSVVRDRFSSDEIFQRIVAAADEEVTASSRELFFSAVAGGFAITITFLLYVSMYESTDADPVMSALLYPLGFLYIIIGNYQLYTENTLPPVALVLERLASIPRLLYVWVFVALGNFAGGGVGAAVLAFTGVFSPEAAAVAVDVSMHGVETPATDLFFKGAMAGLVVAGVVWMDYSSQDTISRVVIVYLAFLAIPMGDLFHSVVSFTELMYLVYLGDVSFGYGFVNFVLPVLAGNTIGGVVLVTVVNYFQTTRDRLESARFAGTERRLSIPEWAFGGFAGRSYVPLLDHPEATGGEGYQVVVPIANPRTESDLVDLAATLASGREAATVHVVHIVQTPNRPSAIADRQRARIEAESEAKLERMADSIGEYDVDCELSTRVTSRSLEEIFASAERVQADLVVMGWGDNRVWGAAHTERPLGELASRLPCDLLVFEDRGFDASRILLPTAGGPDSDLSAEVAKTLETNCNADVTLLHIVDGPEEREEGERFLGEWAADHDLMSADRVVDDSGDVEPAICREAGDQTMILIGATERGLLTRLVTGTLHFDVIEQVDCSVLLAERPAERSLYERLFG